jgi:SNF2 family DNA or RNA helicase
MKLLPHQIKGIQKIKLMETQGKGGILADEMGLGKTVQILAYMKLNKINNKKGDTKPDLIVCKVSLEKHWEEEIRKVYEDIPLPGSKKFKILFYKGKDKEVRLLENRYDYIISTYGMVNKTLGKIEWGRIVLDEAHTIKNGLSPKPPICALRLYEIMDSAEYRWCITGTPFNNRINDLASLAKFIGTEPYNSLAWWQRNRAEDIEKWRNAFVLRRTKDNMIKPPIYHEHKLEPTQNEKTKINRLKKIAEIKFVKWRESKGEVKSELQGEILALINKLRMYSNSYLCDKKFISAHHTITNCIKVSKTIDLLEELIEHDPVKAVVIFSQFTTYLNLLQKVIEECLDVKILRFDGSMNSNQRDEVIQDFVNDNQPRILLISLMAGGVGINLKPCATIIISEPWYNPFIEKQAEERVHRLGQNCQVHVHKFLINNSVETWIAALKEKKLEKAKDLSLISKLDMKSEYKFDDLCELFRKHVSLSSRPKSPVRSNKVSKIPSPIKVLHSSKTKINFFQPNEEYI